MLWMDLSVGRMSGRRVEERDGRCYERRIIPVGLDGATRSWPFSWQPSRKIGDALGLLAELLGASWVLSARGDPPVWGLSKAGTASVWESSLCEAVCEAYLVEFLGRQ